MLEEKDNTVSVSYGHIRIERREGKSEFYEYAVEWCLLSATEANFSITQHILSFYYVQQSMTCELEERKSVLIHEILNNHFEYWKRNIPPRKKFYIYSQPYFFSPGDMEGIFLGVNTNIN